MYDVAVLGGGVAGLSAAVFTGRADLETVVVEGDEPILGRNAHLENYLGFPAGVNPRLLIRMARDQARESGCELVDTEVESLRGSVGEFTVKTGSEDDINAKRVIATSWSNADYLPDEVDTERRGTKTFVISDEDGRTNVDGVYAAGRVADRYHQAIVCAGDGARAGISLVHDTDANFYHDWVAPEGYFTGRGRDVPPGCEEISEEERRERERESIEAMRSYFDEPHPEEPTMHPSVAENE